MKRNITLIICAFFFSTSLSFGQYVETFSTPNKGILQGGSCGSTLPTCTIQDLTGVDWTFEGDLSGIDSEGFSTIANPNNGNNVALHVHDIDVEACWRSPGLTATSGSGTMFMISVDINLSGFDATDYLDIEYQTDGSTWLTVPDQLGNGTSHTLGFTTSANSFNGNINVGPYTAVTGTISLRICTDQNSNSEHVYIDNVTVTNSSGPLPVELVSFRATQKNELVELMWQTASELNNMGFEIERSSDGTDWEMINYTEGNGTTNASQFYSFMDKRPLVGYNYYRLKQVDYDGKYEYSAIRSVFIGAPEYADLQVFPNPNNGQFTLSLFKPSHSDASIRIYGTEGNLIWEKYLNPSEELGHWKKEFNLPSGKIYHVVTYVDGEVLTQKILSMNKR